MPNKQKIQVYSRFLRLICVLGIACMLLFIAAFWIYDGLGISLALKKWYFHFSSLSLGHLSNLTKVIGFLIDLIQNSFFFAILFILIKLFRRYEQLQFFTAENIHYIRLIGFLLLLNQLVHPFYLALRSYILLPPGQKLLIPIFDLIEMKTLFLSFIIIFASHVLDQGRHLEEEVKGTI